VLEETQKSGAQGQSTMSGPDLFGILVEWAVWMEAQGLSQSTSEEYRMAVARAGVRRGKDPLSFLSSDVAAVLASYQGQGPAKGQMLKALRAFFRFAESRELLLDPTTEFKVRKPRVPSRIRYSRLQEIRAVLRSAFRTEERRGWAILFALAVGGRASSLCAVKVSDVSFDPPEVYFAVAKGGRDYSVPLGREGRIAAEHLIKLAKRAGRDTLFGIGYGMFWQWVTEAAEFAGVDASPHTLRRTFGTFMARKTDPETWRRLMSHSDLSQWTRYVGADDERLQAATARVLG
jgi:integrase/recombinase XerD